MLHIFFLSYVYCKIQVATTFESLSLIIYGYQTMCNGIVSALHFHTVFHLSCNIGPETRISSDNRPIILKYQRVVVTIVPGLKSSMYAMLMQYADSMKKKFL
jgi:hypothetical protein